MSERQATILNSRVTQNNIKINCFLLYIRTIKNLNKMFIRLLIAFASVMQATLLLAGQESWAARAEIASRVVCKQADYRFPVEQSQCTPSYALPVGRCNALMRRCVCQHYIFLKWTGKGCGPKRVGDGVSFKREGTR